MKRFTKETPDVYGRLAEEFPNEGQTIFKNKSNRALNTSKILWYDFIEKNEGFIAMGLGEIITVYSSGHELLSEKTTKSLKSVQSFGHLKLLHKSTRNELASRALALSNLRSLYLAADKNLDQFKEQFLEDDIKKDLFNIWSLSQWKPNATINPQKLISFLESKRGEVKSEALKGNWEHFAIDLFSQAPDLNAIRGDEWSMTNSWKQLVRKGNDTRKENEPLNQYYSRMPWAKYYFHKNKEAHKNPHYDHIDAYRDGYFYGLTHFKPLLYRGGKAQSTNPVMAVKTGIRKYLTMSHQENNSVKIPRMAHLLATKIQTEIMSHPFENQEQYLEIKERVLALAAVDEKNKPYLKTAELLMANNRNVSVSLDQLTEEGAKSHQADSLKEVDLNDIHYMEENDGTEIFQSVGNERTISYLEKKIGSLTDTFFDGNNPMDAVRFIQALKNPTQQADVNKVTEYLNQKSDPQKVAVWEYVVKELRQDPKALKDLPSYVEITKNTINGVSSVRDRIVEAVKI